MNLKEVVKLVCTNVCGPVASSILQLATTNKGRKSGKNGSLSWTIKQKEELSFLTVKRENVIIVSCSFETITAPFNLLTETAKKIEELSLLEKLYAMNEEQIYMDLFWKKSNHKGYHIFCD